MIIGTFGIYLVLQVYATIICRGWWRVGALVPLVWMVPVGAVTVRAYEENSNLWPCVLIPASGASFVYLAILTGAVRKRHSREQARGFAVISESSRDAGRTGSSRV